MSTGTIRRVWAGALAAVALAVAGCDSDPAAPGSPESVEIRVHVTGGLVGVDYRLLVDGARGALIGEACTHGCAFQPGQVLLGVSAVQVQDWANRLLADGILDMDGRDFGTECCDRFHAVLSYSDDARESTVRGNADLMPGEFESVIQELMGLMGRRLPIMVDFQVDPAALDRDPLTADTITLAGSTLTFDVEYGGGCEAHVIGLVAVEGWMESFPVQVRVVLTHDDRDDPCDALVRETLAFDLRPLEEAYAQAYPGEAPGTRRLILNLELPGGNGPPVTHTF